MNFLSLIPTPDTIPAPAWLFQVLDVFTFTIHILFINIVIGGSLIIFFSRLNRKEAPPTESLHGAIASKIPTTFALGITFGVAPLLFIQVIYGHLIYTSSVLMAVYWILIIPFLILAYYGAYIHIKNYTKARILSIISIAITSILVLYIAFIFVNNMTLMVQPEKWTAYFNNRSGTILNLTDAILLPRYLHFITASVAVASIFMALPWYMRQKKNVSGAEKKVKSALRIFAIATCVQVVIGFWFLLAIPSEFILAFMGKNLVYTIFLFMGIVLAIGSIISAFMGKFLPTVIHLLATIVVMVITRANLRTLYMQDYFNLNQLTLKPQYDVMALFFAVFIVGLIIVGYMLKIAYKANERRVA